MRIFPRLARPRLKLLVAKRRSGRKYFSLRRRIIAAEFVGLVVALFLLLFSKQAESLNALGSRLIVLTSLSLFLILALIHVLINRKIILWLERRFAPTRYNERRIFFDLGEGARTISSLDQLFTLIARKIRSALETENVSIFVREASSGNYLLRASSPPFKADDTDNRATPVQLAAGAFVVRRLNHLSTPMTIKPSDFDTWLKGLNTSPALKQARLLERETLDSARSRLLVQIRRGAEMVGILSLGSRRSNFAFSKNDTELLVSIASQLALVIDNARLTERMVAEERIRRELALAAEVQQRLLPANAPEGLPIEVAGFCEPARGVGGDFYDYLNIDADRMGIAIADVAGKGMAAALLTSTVQATLRSLLVANGSAPTADLATMVRKLNKLIFNSTRGQSYVTFFYGCFDRVTRSLTYVNAGHNPPLHLIEQSSQNFNTLTTGGLIAGAFEDENYQQETVQMQSGDLLFLYTDGLSEALNRNGDEFGEKRIKDALSANIHRPVHEIRDELVKRVNNWRMNIPLQDDLTFVIMRVT